jgi:hypothetical protein
MPSDESPGYSQSPFGRRDHTPGVHAWDFYRGRFVKRLLRLPERLQQDPNLRDCLVALGTPVLPFLE